MYPSERRVAIVEDTPPLGTVACKRAQAAMCAESAPSNSVAVLSLLEKEI